MKRNFVDIDSDRCRLDLRAVTSLLMFGIALDSAASTSRDWEITWRSGAIDGSGLARKLSSKLSSKTPKLEQLSCLNAALIPFRINERLAEHPAVNRRVVGSSPT